MIRRSGGKGCEWPLGMDTESECIGFPCESSWELPPSKETWEASVQENLCRCQSAFPQLPQCSLTQMNSLGSRNGWDRCAILSRWILLLNTRHSDGWAQHWDPSTSTLNTCGEQPATWWQVGYTEPFHRGVGRDLPSVEKACIPGMGLLFLPLVLLPAPSLVAFPNTLFAIIISLSKEPILQRKKWGSILTTMPFNGFILNLSPESSWPSRRVGSSTEDSVTAPGRRPHLASWVYCPSGIVCVLTLVATSSMAGILEPRNQ